MSGFQTKIDIINRGLTKIGAQRIATLTDDSINASEAVAAYDKLRRAELRRSRWRFAIRRAALRPIEQFNHTKFVTFAAWSNVTTYAQNDVILGSDNVIYFSKAGANLDHDPTSTDGYWTVYFGPVVAQEFVTTWGAGFTYAAGDHAIGSDGLIYTSLAADNINHNPVGDGNVHWSLATTVDSTDNTSATTDGFYSGEIVFIGGTVYLSVYNGNTSTPPSSKWRTLTTQPTLAVPQFIYPIGSGPLSQSSTRNVFPIPAGYMRDVPRDSKAGSYSAIGAPTNLSYTDWLKEGNYIVSQSVDPILFRFVADIADVTAMDDMFCEGLACRIALELCPRMTDSDNRTQLLAKEYDEFMSEARLTSAIEQDPVEAPLDDLLQVRY